MTSVELGGDYSILQTDFPLTFMTQLNRTFLEMFVIYMDAYEKNCLCIQGRSQGVCLGVAKYLNFA